MQVSERVVEPGHGTSLQLGIHTADGPETINLVFDRNIISQSKSEDRIFAFFLYVLRFGGRHFVR